MSNKNPKIHGRSNQFVSNVPRLSTVFVPIVINFSRNFSNFAKMQFRKSLNIDIMEKPSMRRGRQPNFIPSGTDTSLFFRRTRVYIRVHKEKLPSTFIFNRPTLILGSEVKLETFTEVLRFLYVKKMYAHPGNYRELLKIATVYSFSDVERELLFNMDNYLTYADLMRFDDPRLTALFEKKLRLSCTEALRYLKVQDQRNVDKREHVALHLMACICCGEESCEAVFPAPWLQYCPPERIRSVLIIDSDNIGYKDLHLTRISFAIQDIYGFAKADIHVMRNTTDIDFTVKCTPQSKTLIPFGLTMAADFNDLFLPLVSSLKFVIVLKGSIFVDKIPGRAKVTLTMKDARGLKFQFFSIPLRSELEAHWTSLGDLEI